MRVNCTGTSEYVKAFIGINAEGRVHSVYEHTVNLLFGGQLLALQSAGSQLSPISLVLALDDEELSRIGIAADMTCRISDGCIHVADAEISIDNGRIYDPAIGHVFFDSKTHGDPPEVLDSEKSRASDDRESRIAAVIENAVFLLHESGRGGFSEILLSPEASGDMILDRARAVTAEAAIMYADGDFDRAAKVLTGLIGLGSGLTPAGDDFLTGVLAALAVGRASGSAGTYDSFAEELRKEITAGYDRTNDISAAFLKCAADGMFSEAVIKLFSAEGGDAGDFLEIGHTSGMDSLAGIVYGLKLAFKK